MNVRASIETGMALLIQNKLMILSDGIYKRNIFKGGPEGGDIYVGSYPPIRENRIAVFLKAIIPGIDFSPSKPFFQKPILLTLKSNLRQARTFLDAVVGYFHYSDPKLIDMLFADIATPAKPGWNSSSYFLTVNTNELQEPQFLTLSDAIANGLFVTYPKAQ